MKVLLGICGGIAAYKAAALTSFLVQRGDEVDVIMTDDAQRFIGSLTFAALTRRRVWTSLWEEQPEIPHITLVREADVFAIVPATANVLAKIAHGIADDLLTNAALAARIPLVVAPAMNAAMFDHPATQTNLRDLHARGVTIVEPESGFLAEREIGVGRLAEQDAIVAALDRVTKSREQLRGERVLITAGPTREAIDPVRFISNGSSGATGIELAREALARGADVDLVLGPTALVPPAGARVTHVISAQQLRDAAVALARGADIAIASAAVADWRPVHEHSQKVKKEEIGSSIALERTPDTLAEIGANKNGTFLVGFAAETESHEQNAREKLRQKALDAIAVNDVSQGRGVGDVPNHLVVLWGDEGRLDLGDAPKAELARRLWDALLDIRARRH